jgi:replicative DNA helicase
VLTETELRHIIREELIGISPHEHPPPCNLDAEGEVLSAILCGHLAHAHVPDLEPSHFYSMLNGRIFNATLHTVNLATIAKAAEKQGFRGPLHDYLVELRDGIPYADLVRCRALADEIIECKHKRDLITKLQEVNAGLRAGRLSFVAALDELSSTASAVTP